MANLRQAGLAVLRKITEMQKKQWWFIAGLVLLVLIIIGIERWIGWQTLLEPWYRIAPGTLILATLLTWVSYLARALRVYDYFLPATHGGFTVCLKLTLLHNLINNLLPMRSGEISFPVLMRRYFATPLVKSLAALLWFRFMDLHALGLVALIALGSYKLESWLVILSVMYWLSLPWWLFQLQQSSQWTGWIQRLPSRFQDHIAKAKAGLPQTPSALWRAWLWTLLNWLVKLTVFAWILSLFAPAPIPFPVAVLGTTGGDLTSILPIHGVAGTGTYEAGVVAILLPFEIPAETALVAAVNLHLFMLGLSLASGLWALVLRYDIPATEMLRQHG